MTLRGANTSRESPLGSRDDVQNDDVADIFDDEIVADEGVDAQSPGAKDPKDAKDERPSPLSVARDVIAKGRETEIAAAAASSDSKVATGQDPAAAADGAADPAAAGVDDYKDVPFHQHPRFQQLVRERNELLVVSKAHQGVRDALEQSGLEPEEFAQTLAIASMMRRDPAQAFELLKPIVKQLAIDSGNLVPADIAAEYKAGRITKEFAIELSRQRAKTANDEKYRDWSEKRAQANQHRQQRQEAVSAVSDWERKTAASDPDFAQIKDGVLRRLRIRMDDHNKGGGAPITKADALKWAKEEYTAEKQYRRPTPDQRREQRPAVRIPIGGRASGDGAQGRPRNAMEVAQRALGR